MDFLIVGLVIAVILGKVFHGVYLSPSARVRRALNRVERSPVRQLAEGTVRVTGRARGRTEELLTAPITERPCLAYQLRVEELAHEHWREVLLLRDARPFAVEDETGTVLVEPEASFELALVEDAKGGHGWLENWDSAQWKRTAALLQRANIALTSRLLASDRKFRYREGALEEGESVAVRGHAVREVRLDGERPGPRSPPERLVLRGSSAEPVSISDDPSTHQ